MDIRDKGYFTPRPLSKKIFKFCRQWPAYHVELTTDNEQSEAVMAVHYASVAEKLIDCGIDIDQNFYTLNNSQVCDLLEMADVQSYRRPKNANGSRVRYYFAALQRDYRKCQK